MKIVKPSQKELKWYISLFKRGVNPEFLKFRDRCNFWIFTATYIKVYIFGKVLSRSIHF